MTALIQKMGGNGPPVVMIHGFGADRMTWMFLGPLLMRDFSVFAVDLPGHGAASSDVGDGSIEFLAKSVAAVLPEQPVRIVGHSMGGAVALELARAGFASHCALIAPAGLGAAVDATFLRDFPEIRNDEDAKRVLGLLVSKARLVTPQMASYVRDGLAKPGRRAALRSIAGRLMDIDGGIPKDLPTTVIWGDADQVNSPPKEAPVEDYHLLGAVGHMPHVEAVSRISEPILSAFSREK